MITLVPAFCSLCYHIYIRTDEYKKEVYSISIINVIYHCPLVRTHPLMRPSCCCLMRKPLSRHFTRPRWETIQFWICQVLLDLKTFFRCNMWNWVVTDQELPAGKCLVRFPNPLAFGQVRRGTWPVNVIPSQDSPEKPFRWIDKYCLCCLLLSSSNLDNLDNEIAKAEKLRTTSPHYSFSRLTFKTWDAAISVKYFRNFLANDLFRRYIKILPAESCLKTKSPGVFSIAWKISSKYFGEQRHPPFTLQRCCQKLWLNLSD